MPAFGQALAPLDADARGLPGYLACLREEGVALPSAHRGGPAKGYPENAISTFARIAKSAPALLEVDVRSTADGVLVLLHDRDLDEDTSCAGPVSEVTMRTLRNCRLRDPFGELTDEPIPTLADALAWAKDTAILQLDVKRRETIPATVELVKQADAFDRVVFITYSLEVAGQVADLHPDAVVSTTLDSVEDVDALEEAGLPVERLIGWIGFGREKPDLVAALEARGVHVNFGTLGFGDSLDDQIEASGQNRRYRQIADTGVDIIATDRPLAAYRALRRGDDPRDDIRRCNAAPS